MGVSLVIHEGKTIPLNIGEVKNVFVEDHLGSGGFADAWKVKDVTTSNYYVLKNIRIKPKMKSDEKKKLIQRIKNEADVRIPSEYITQPIGINEYETDNFGILFEYIPGSSFSEWIQENKDASWELKRDIFIKILMGINDAHAMNIIHRDLKPDNVLITSEEEPKIIDFGLAKFKDKSVTVTGDLGGTIPYLDPFALLKGLKYVDARCDVYAMGVLLNELISGEHYWLRNKIEFGEFVGAVSTGCQNILELDPDFEKIGKPEQIKAIAQCTMFDPERRVKSINEFIAMLGGVPAKKVRINVDFSLTSPVLVVEDGSAKGSMNLLTVEDGGQKLLGRMNLDATNNTLSKNHAVITREGTAYYIHDAGSKNGTFLNGSFVGKGIDNRVEIAHTDRIRFADLWTRFVFLKR